MALRTSGRTRRATWTCRMPREPKAKLPTFSKNPRTTWWKGSSFPTFLPSARRSQLLHLITITQFLKLRKKWGKYPNVYFLRKTRQIFVTLKYSVREAKGKRICEKMCKIFNITTDNFFCSCI